MNIILPGVMRCGTTSLRNYLSLHPDIQAPKNREFDFFSRHYDAGMDWYKSQLRRGGLDKSPNYMADPDVPARIAADLPDAKIIVLLRDPVERAWSHYRWMKSIQRYKGSFVDACDHHGDKDGWYSILLRGHYSEQLLHWMKYVPAKQIYVTTSEALWKYPNTVYAGITKFLKLEPFTPKKFRRSGTVNSSIEIPRRTRDFLKNHYKLANMRLRTLLDRDLKWT